MTTDEPVNVYVNLTVVEESTILKTSIGETLKIASDIVSIEIYNDNMKVFNIDIKINFPVVKQSKIENSTDVIQILVPVCYYTQRYESSTSTEWSTKGCETIYNNIIKSNVTCKCNHLTSFILLMKPKRVRIEDKNVSQLTNVGVAISIVFLAVTLGVIYGFKDLRNSERYKMLRHLVIALLCVNCLFLCLEGNVQNISEIACSVLAGCLHYSLLATFSWMLIISTNVYIKIKHPFADHDKRFSYCRYIGWIGPAIAVGVTAGITNVNYASNKCWLNTDSGAIWTFIVPVCLTVVIVHVQLLVIGYVAFMKSKLPNQTEEEMQAFKRIRNVFQGLLLLAPAVGVSWIFGVIIIFYDWKIMEYIYVVLNSMQGFFVWLSQCVLSNEVRQAFRKKFGSRIMQESTTATKSSVTHNTGRIVVEDM